MCYCVMWSGAGVGIPRNKARNVVFQVNRAKCLMSDDLQFARELARILENSKTEITTANSKST